MDKLPLRLVVDANVFIKIFVLEPDTQTAREFLSFCNQHAIQLIAPSLFKYEVIGVCVQKKVDMDKLLKGLAIYLQRALKLQEPTASDWQLAYQICQSGHNKSGYPSIYDSIYHAMAINQNSYFITADNRHLIKAKQFGHIGLLEHWRSVMRCQ